jgi:RNA recognition motif. (a.k.a. RRM, RBD, or RNP domain)
MIWSMIHETWIMDHLKVIIRVGTFSTDFLSVPVIQCLSCSGGYRMSTLFFVNVPHNCSDSELTQWVESSGIGVKHVRVIRDLVAGVSPSFAYVDIEEKISVADAVRTLNGRHIRERMILVTEARKGATAA